MTGHVNRRGWIVLTSVESDDRSLCVDLFEHVDTWLGDLREASLGDLRSRQVRAETR